MDIDHILVNGCPLCEIFLNPDKNIRTTLYYPEKELVAESDFVILDCETCNIPMVVIRDHITSPSNQIWGKMLYRAKKTIGYNVQLRCKPRKIKDHFHCHVIDKKEY